MDFILRDIHDRSCKNTIQLELDISFYNNV